MNGPVKLAVTRSVFECSPIVGKYFKLENPVKAVPRC